MAKPIADGSKAPAFTLERDGSSEVSLKDFKGKALVLYFYPKDDTPGCTTEAIGFSAKLKQFQKAGAEIVGVSKDTVAKHDKFKAKHKLGVTLASDPEGETCEAYGVWKEKTLYGRKYMGIERSTFLIDAEGRIAHQWRGVKIAGHVEEVLEAVKSL
jgi:peroxiredoxin Q/BCP